MSNYQAMFPVEPRTLVDLLHLQAERLPDQIAYTFLPDGEGPEQHLTYRELDQQARGIASMLRELGLAGERALLLYPPGLDYLAAFFGCLYVGVTAVPAYPPQPKRSAARLQAIVSDSQALVALTTGPILATIEQRFTHAPELARLRWLVTDTPASESDWREPAISADTLAFLQYTSGSTATPKGVMVSHRNLLHNLGHIYRCFGHGPDSRGVIWLPPYHDMGLIGGILQPLYGGFPVTLMPPVAFLQRPLRWLQAISRYRATTSGGPNFAYDLCVRKITPEQRATLDLSPWRVAFTGAEPIRPETLERFAATFAECGFRRAAFYPCYGLAEATLIVSGGAVDTLPLVQSFDSAALEQHQVVAARDATGRQLVGCGHSLLDQQVIVVHPERMVQCAPDQVGEIWVAGPSVAQGYWNRPDETARSFQAYLADTGAGPFLRTGDLGLLRNGEVFITGRLKDLIIIRGRNHYPQDIEHTVAGSHPALRPNGGAAFSAEVDGEERLVVVQEVERQHRHTEPAAIIDAMRQAITEQHEIMAHTIVLLRPGTIPLTSSGKIQRRACREQFLAGSLQVIGQSILEQALPTEATTLDRATALAAAPAEREALIAAYLQAQIAQHIGDDGISLHKPLSQLGLDSLIAVELHNRLDNDLGVHVPMVSFLQDSTLSELTAEIAAQLAASAAMQSQPRAAEQTLWSEQPLSYGQRAIWFLHQIAPENAAYNIASAVRIRSELDIPALQWAIDALAERHPALRTRFATTNGEVVQSIDPSRSIVLQHEDAAGWSNATLHDRVSAAAHQPFDLERDVLLRLQLYTRAPDEHILLLVVHHIISDFWSLTVLLDDLSTLYSAAITRQPAQLAPLTASYKDYIQWQNEWLQSSSGHACYSYWQQQLGGDLPILDLPTDQPRPAVQSHRGATHTFKLDASLTDSLKALAQQAATTLYTTLLAAFQTLLFRYTGQEDLLIGSPTTGRSRADVADLVGYFVNPVVLRTNLAGNPSFEALLQRTRRTVLDALAHQEYPFALLAERLQPRRDASRSPIFQVMFVLQKAHRHDADGLTAFAVGAAGAQLRIGALPLEAVATEQQAAQFDLMLTVAESQGSLVAAFQYATDLFESATIARMAGHFQSLLDGIAAQPQQPIANLPLLTDAEHKQLAAAWQATALEYAGERCIHRLIEEQAAHNPDAVAVICGETRLSYGQLNQRANQLARYLRQHAIDGSTPEQPLVGVCLDRSPDLMVAILGILKAGAAYVPLDPSYPLERLAQVLDDARPALVLTQTWLLARLPQSSAQAMALDAVWPAIDRQPAGDLPGLVTSDQLAYVIYTSGSTGRPKGVMITHGSVNNFFHGMDQRIGCTVEDRLLAVTSIAFDISVLELLWTLARGTTIILGGEQSGSALRSRRARPLDFSLFYFASADSTDSADKYRLLIEGAKFADEHGFAAVWTPERHFHAFGGLYPNPAVTSAALATITKNVQIRGGSVVLPLHHPIRVAEEWSVVDNLSQGRIGIAFASGWHSNDFVFFPDRYAQRKDELLHGLETFRQLWRGEQVTVEGGSHNEITVQIFPKPIRRDVPIWLTAAGNSETFIKAGELGLNVLTHLLGQSLDEVAEKIVLYREARARHGHDPQAGYVTLMLHTFIGADVEQVREKVRVPFTNYLRSSVDLIRNLIKSQGLPLDLETMSPQAMDDLLAFAFNRYFETSALFGTVATAGALIERVRAIGVDEVACLIDFGVDAAATLESLHQLDALRRLVNTPVAEALPVPVLAAQHRPTLLQCTPSMMHMLLQQSETLDALQSLRALMLGGEALPPALAQTIKQRLPARLINMYGPTETTIWSATHEITDGTIGLGTPIANTTIVILDRHLQPVPPLVAGELHIGGDGLARGYLSRPDLTAEHFVPDPFAPRPGQRLYRTGDLARYRSDGTLEFLGRIDQQVKLRGYRIELGEIEATLRQHPAVAESAVVARGQTVEERQLVGFVTLKPEARLSAGELRQFVQQRLPDYMVPAVVTILAALPLTANGKIDRKTLQALEQQAPERQTEYIAPRTKLERTITEIWQRVLKLEQIGVDDNFFDLGGHSLLMAQVHRTLEETMQRSLPLIKMLEYPTISALATYLSREQDQPEHFQASVDRAQRQREILLRQRQRMKKDPRGS